MYYSTLNRSCAPAGLRLLEFELHGDVLFACNALIWCKARYYIVTAYETNVFRSVIVVKRQNAAFRKSNGLRNISD